MRTTHHFTLVFEGVDLQEESVLEALFEAGCDDATIGRVGPTQYIDFDRDAESLADAVFEAVVAIEAAVPGARAIHLEPDELVSMAEIADRLDRSRESIRLLIKGDRGPGGFPPPATHFKTRNPLWAWTDVVTWFTTADPQVLQKEADVAKGAESAPFIAAFNATLRWRETRKRISPNERRKLQKLAR